MVPIKINRRPITLPQLKLSLSTKTPIINTKAGARLIKG